MGIENLDLNGGFFKATKPFTTGGWIVWAIGLVVVFVGLFYSLTASHEEVYNLYLLAIPLGFLIMAIPTPGSFAAELHDIKKNSLSPEELEAQAKEKGLSIDSWLLSQTTLVPTNDPSDWVLPAPGPASWNKEDRYGPERDGEPLPEHPVKVGTPIPATFTTFAILIILCIISTLFAVAEYMGDTQSLIPAVIIAITGGIITIIGYFHSKKIRQMIDTPTSLIRSMAAGHPELVGQVRPAPEGVMRVVVDGNQSMVVDNMVAFHWAYEQYQCRTVRTKNGTREECHWVTIRSDSGGCPFILHDGTGGVRVNPQTFKRKEWGKFLKRWDGAFAKSLVKQMKAQAIAGMLGGGRVRRHRWTIFGLRLGNPAYALGNTRQRTDEELRAEGLDGSLQNSLLEVIGNEDAPGIKSVIHRGTELSNLGNMRSGVEAVILPLILTIGAIIMFGMG